MEAAEGSRWIHEPVEGDADGPRLRTQRRWIERAAHVLAVCQRLNEQVAERAVGVLGLMGLDHQRARRRFGGTRQMSERGRVLCALLEPLALDAQLWARVLGAGTVGGAWGEGRMLAVSIGRLGTPRAIIARAGRAPP